ncbi:MAG: aminomethyl transferase family protein [Armatimonadetes bacterium]|nr:aminomethyl transferase family protein [Armatimonadota bacterium]
MLPHTHPAATLNLAGWEVAEHFGDPLAEIAAVHAAAGLIDHSERGRVLVRGEDRLSWLHRQVTNDILRLTPGTGCRALLLTIKGRIQCDLRVFVLPDALLLETSFDNGEWLAANLRSQILFRDKATVEDVRSATAQLGVHGPDAADRVRQATSLDPSELPIYGVAGTDALRVARTDELGEPGYELFAPAERGVELWDALAASAQPFGWQASEVLRVEAGRPRWGAELTPDVFPAEAELEEALSHTKGCYPGQEVVARMRDRGHANRSLRRLVFQGALPPRDAELVVGEKVVGHVTSAVASPVRGLVGMGYVRREVTADSVLSVRWPGGEAEGEVMSDE